MVFSSLEFLFLYFAVTVFIYFISPLKWRNAVLLVVSLIFYGWGEPLYVFLMVGTILIDYVCGFFTDKYKKAGKIGSAKAWMIAAIVSNLLLLGFFKYWNFIINNINAIKRSKSRSR